MRAHNELGESAVESGWSERDVELTERTDEVPHRCVSQRGSVVIERQSGRNRCRAHARAERVQSRRQAVEVLARLFRGYVDVASWRDRCLLRDRGECADDHVVDTMVV